MPLRFKEGEWIGVPLDDGTFAAGLIARVKGNVLFGYFFGPTTVAPAELTTLAHLTPGDAVLVGMFGVVGLRQGRWPMLGGIEGWDRAAWPIPVFVRHDELTGQTFRVFYDDKNPNKVLGEELISPGGSTDGVRDGLMGARFVELVLNDLFGVAQR